MSRIVFLCVGFFMALISAGHTYALSEERLIAVEPIKSELLETKSLLLAVEKVGSSIVAVGEQGRVVYSKDHGASWALAEQSTPSTLNAVTFISKTVGFAVGHDSLIVKTTDGGQTWRQVHFDPLKAEDDYSDEAYDDEEYGDDASYDDQDYYEDDYSDSYEDAAGASPAQGSPLMDVVFVSEQDGFAVGAYGLFLQTSDAGETWAAYTGKIKNDDGWHYYSINTNDSGQLFISGEKGTAYSSDDMGKKFKAVSTAYDGTFFNSLVENNGDVWLFGLQGKAYYGDKKRLKSVETGTQTTLSSALRHNGKVFIVGNSGVILVGDKAKLDEYILQSRVSITDVVGLDATNFIATTEYGLVRFSIKN